MTSPRRAILAVSILSLISAPRLAAQAAVVANITEEMTGKCTTEDVVLVRLGESQPVAADRGGCPFAATHLRVGDQLKNTSDRTAVELQCPNGTRMNLPGRFEIMIARPSGASGCAIDLTTGTAYVTTTGESQINGLAALATTGTEYSTRVWRSQEGAQQEVTVYQGEVSVAVAGANVPVTIKPQTKARLMAGQPAVAREGVTGADVRAAADVWAVADVSRSLVTLTPKETSAARRDFTRLYVDALQNPANASARVALAAQQLNLQLVDLAAYQVKRAEELPADPQARASVLYMKGVVLRQTGNADASRETIRQAEQMDAGVAQRVAGQYRLQARFVISDAKEAIVMRALRVDVQAEPATVQPGQASRITVRVTAGGAAVAGAVVKVAAGGGVFAGAGDRFITGETDGNGVFITSWQCQPCAPAYGLSVTVEKPGYQNVSSDVTVRIGGTGLQAADGRR